MSAFEYIIDGFLIGLVCSIPLGPMGVLIIQKTLSKGALPGFFSGLGAACADLFYASIVAFGLNLVIENIVSEHRLLIQILGGILLVILGVLVFCRNPLDPAQPGIKERRRISKSGLFGDFVSLFFLTVTNPVAIVVFMGAFGATNVLVTSEGEQIGVSLKVWLLAGLLFGAASWWYILSSLVSIFRKKFRMHTLITINRTAGIILAVLGIFAVLSAFETVRELLDAANLPAINF